MYQNPKHKRDSDCQLTIGYQERDRRSMRENEVPENRNHERIGSVLKKAADPVLEPTAKRKLRANNFVLAKDEKENTDCDAKARERLGA